MSEPSADQPGDELVKPARPERDPAAPYEPIAEAIEDAETFTERERDLLAIAFRAVGRAAAIEDLIAEVHELTDAVRDKVAHLDSIEERLGTFETSQDIDDRIAVVETRQRKRRTTAIAVVVSFFMSMFAFSRAGDVTSCNRSNDTRAAVRAVLDRAQEATMRSPNLDAGQREQSVKLYVELKQLVLPQECHFLPQP